MYSTLPLSCLSLSFLHQLKSCPFFRLQLKSLFLRESSAPDLVRSVAGKGDPFQDPKLGSCLTLGNELSEETHVLTEQEILSGKGTRVESRTKGTQENGSASWLAVSGFMVMGLVSGLSLANHSYSESFLVVHALFSQDGCQREGFWEVVRQVVSPFDLSWTLPVGGGLLVPCSLAGPPVIKQLMQVVTMVPGQGGRFQSACFP